jgi:molybdate transport system ATP-binding protein
MLSLDIEAKTGDLTLKICTDIPEGVSAIFGPSGCGKTTLLHAIAGLIPCQGSIRFHQHVWQQQQSRLPVHKRQVGYVFQDDRLFPHLSVLENLRYGYVRAQKKQLDMRLNLDDVISRFDLAPLLQRSPTTLSGGESRRVSIARALCAQPQLLLLDEPLTGLDHQRKTEILPYLAAITRDLSIPTLYVSHINDEIAHLCAHTLVMADGKLVDQGDTAKVLGRLWQSSAASQQNLGESGSLLEAQVIGFDQGTAMVTLQLGGQSLNIISPTKPATAQLRLFLAASDVAIALEKPRQLSIRNALAGVISDIRPLDGAQFGLVAVDIHLDSSDLDNQNHGTPTDKQRIVSHISAAACQDLKLGPGTPIFALIKSARIASPAG